MCNTQNRRPQGAKIGCRSRHRLPRVEQREQRHALKVRCIQWKSLASSPRQRSRNDIATSLLLQQSTRLSSTVLTPKHIHHNFSLETRVHSFTSRSRLHLARIASIACANRGDGCHKKKNCETWRGWCKVCLRFLLGRYHQHCKYLPRSRLPGTFH